MTVMVIIHFILPFRDNIHKKKRPRNAQPTIIYPQFSIVIFRTYMFLF